jgi:transposase
MNRIKIAPHLTVETLEARYRSSKDAINRSHWQILWLLVRGETTSTVSKMTGYSVPWIRALVKRYNAEGEGTVGDQRHHNPGQPQLLNTKQQAQLRKLLLAATERGERWTGRQVAVWMSEQLGRPVGKQRGYEVLQRLRMSLQVPRPAHEQADKGEQERFKKTTRT